MRGIGKFGLVNSLQQKLIWLQNKPETVFTAFFSKKKYIVFFGTKERNLENKILWIMDKEQAE